ncbi:MAG: hypothetical protein GY869_23380, partial [Planctomycetes bacterium]|nr:hypothetical protein [Planctomycetota bacterium]
AGSDSETKWDYISVSPCGEKPVKRGAAGYNTIQAAYNAAGADATIRLQATDDYYEDLIASQDKDIVLTGGYNCEFTERWMETTTTIHGKLEVRSGEVTVDNLIIR